MPKWIIKHTGPHGANDVAYIANHETHLSVTLGNGINAAVGYAGLSTNRDYEHRHRLLHMTVDQALAYLQREGRGTYEIFSSETSWTDRLNDHTRTLRSMGCAVVVLTPEDIVNLGPHDDEDEPLVTYAEAEKWMELHYRDVEEALLGDYWSESIYPLFDLYPIPGTEHHKCGYRILPREDFMMLEKLNCYTGATSMTSEQIDANERREAAVLKQRAQQHAGAYVLYDPEDDAEGFLLVGDDMIELDRQATQRHREMHGA